MAQRFTIGRDRASDIAIADDSVSRTHAEIWLEDDGTLMLADHGSSNGTELIRAGEASALSKAAVLPGDQVRFGGVTLTVKDLIDAVEAKSPGALTRPPQAAPMQKPTTPPAPPSLPPIPNHPPAPPPIAAQAPQPAQGQSPPRVPKPIAAPPPLPPIPGGQPALPPVAAPPPLPKPNVAPPPPSERAVAPPPPPPPIPDRPHAERGAAPVVRCECGAIKTQGQVCPACHR